jgi:hypothetical protein
MIDVEVRASFCAGSPPPFWNSVFPYYTARFRAIESYGP